MTLLAGRPLAIIVGRTVLVQRARRQHPWYGRAAHPAAAERACPHLRPRPVPSGQRREACRRETIRIAGEKSPKASGPKAVTVTTKPGAVEELLTMARLPRSRVEVPLTTRP